MMVEAVLLRFQIRFFKKRRCEKLRNGEPHSLTQLVDDPQLHRVISAIDHIADRGLRDTAFHIELILRHAVLLQQFFETCADCLIELHPITTVPVAVLALYGDCLCD